jgi:ArsR family transcriptional regulator, zinc-responsive transcriptional repressor
MTTDATAHQTDPIAEATRMMRVLSDGTRIRLLGLLQGGELNVTTLCQRLALPQPTVSHHLGLLREAQLVTARRAGKQVFYALNPEHITNLDERGGLTVCSGAVEVRFCDDGRLGESGPPPIAEEIAGATLATCQ